MQSNVYNRIKACSAQYSGIPQYFIYGFEFDGLIDKSSYDKAFEQAIGQIYPKLAKHYDVRFTINKPVYFSTTDTQSHEDILEAELSDNYLDIIEQQDQAPIIALLASDQQRSSIWYLVNHVYNDALAAKMLHLAICQYYQQRPNTKDDICHKLFCLGDESFLDQVLQQKKTSLADQVLTLSKELLNGLVVASPFVKANRLQFSSQDYDLALSFQRFSFPKTALAKLPKGSTIAQLSALITKAYMDSFDSQNCNFTIPVDLRTRSMRWLLGNPIGGIFIQCKKEQSLGEIVTMIDRKLEYYQQKPILYWLYQMVRSRMQNMSDNTIYQKTLKYSSKAHFISTYLGQTDRCNAKKSILGDLVTKNSYCYSYPLQTSIAISLAITSFNGDISINLSASKHAFSRAQQQHFQQQLMQLLGTAIQCGRPFK